MRYKHHQLHITFCFLLPLFLFFSVRSKLVAEQKSPHLVLSENALDNLTLPVTPSQLEKHFQGDPNIPFTLKRGIYQQDGPDYLGYRLFLNSQQVAFFKYDEDSVSLTDLYLADSSECTDIFGLKIGNTFREIKEKRLGIKIYADLHQHIFAYVKGSNIMYEIYGEWTAQEPNKVGNNTPEVSDVLGWKIKSIIWRR